MIISDLVIPNLAVLGVERRGDGVAPDLETIWISPYPVLTNYQKLMRRLGWKAYAGGTRDMQGPSYVQGYITSGYRDLVLGGNTNSPHLFAIALDIAAGGIREQVRAARLAVDYFNRIGLYPENGFIHVDLATPTWMQRHGGRLFWVRKGGKYTSFDDLAKAIIFAEGRS